MLRPGRSATVVVVVGSGSGRSGKSTRIVVVVVVGATVARVTVGSSLRGATVVTLAGLVVVASSPVSLAFVVVAMGTSVDGLIGAWVGATRGGSIVVLGKVVVEEVVVVGEIVDGEVLTVTFAGVVVGALSDVVGGTVAATVVGVVVGVPGRVVIAAAAIVVGARVVLVVVLVVVVVGGVVRGGAVSVMVVVPPPSMPLVVPSVVLRVLVMTEPSGRTMMRPSVPPGLIQMRCSSTVMSTGPVPGIGMIWMVVPVALRTIIWRVRSLRR